MYFLWGMWGDRALALIQHGFQAPHMNYFCGEQETVNTQEKSPKLCKKPSKSPISPQFCGEIPPFFGLVGRLKATPRMG